MLPLFHHFRTDFRCLGLLFPYLVTSPAVLPLTQCTLANRMCWRFALAKEGQLSTPLCWTSGAGRPGCYSVTLMRKLCRDFQKVKPSEWSAESTLWHRLDLAALPSVWWSPLPQPWPPSPFLCEWFSPHKTYSSDLNPVNSFLMLQPADGLLQVSELPPTNSLSKMQCVNKTAL